MVAGRLRGVTAGGPSCWAREYPVAKGPRQSPIDIDPDSVERDPSVEPLRLRYSSRASRQLSNTGSSFMLSFHDSSVKGACVIEGGALHGPYRLRQLHMHWGSHDHVGSEHTVKGKTYPAELHLVHWSADRYASFEEAAVAPDGLAVVGVFLEVGEENKELKKITDLLPRITAKGSAVDVRGVNPSLLLPPSLSLWSYAGSLTTPPLYESVSWLMLQQPIHVSREQLSRFRELSFSGENERSRPMVDNFRPPQPLCGRVVTAYP
ncbi:carbonic anhydrase 7-like isoform X1 [Lampetra fluviatilis]